MAAAKVRPMGDMLEIGRPRRHHSSQLLSLSALIRLNAENPRVN
jgi:hypothetical protein